MRRFLCLFFVAVSAFADSPITALRVDIQVPDRSYRLRWAAATTPKVRAYVMDAGRPYTNFTAAWTGRLVYAESWAATQFVEIVSSSITSNEVAFDLTEYQTATNGTGFVSQIILEGAGLTYQWGRGTVVIDPSPGTMPGLSTRALKVGSFDNITGDPGSNPALAAYVASHAGGTATNELDPYWAAVSNSVQTKAGNGETAYGWGNHAASGYWTNGLQEAVMSAWVVTGFDWSGPEPSGTFVLGGYDSHYVGEAEGTITSVWLRSTDGLWAEWGDFYGLGRMIGPIAYHGADPVTIPGLLYWYNFYATAADPPGYDAAHGHWNAAYVPLGSAGTAFVSYVESTVTVQRAASGGGLVISVNGVRTVAADDPRVTGALTNGAAYATASQGTSADTAFGWGNHATNGYLKSAASYTRYLARSTSGNEVWVMASQTGVTAAVVGSGVTLSYAVPCDIKSIDVRWNGASLGTSFTLDIGTNVWPSTSMANRSAPTVTCYREDTRSPFATFSVSLGDPAFSQITIGSLISTTINRVHIEL